MRLLNAETSRLEEYFGDAIPKYTILSHRWRQDEVLYNDMLGDLTEAKKKLGFRKIERCMKQTLQDGYQYCWIDTCCIDKSSSSELSEAINSMFAWYRAAQICYAYLDDVSAHTLELSLFTHNSILSGYADPKQAFFSSQWWTRGWTLQELIAPQEVRFYSKNWDNLGTKSKLVDLIAKISGVKEDILINGELGRASVAQKMCWASKRTTTRIEDMAYCLLGIFGLNMPLLYGEGENAFIRLQEEIIKTSDDQTIFAWTSETKSQSTFRGLLAKSAAEFRNCQNILAIDRSVGEPYTITNRGLRIAMFAYPIRTPHETLNQEHVVRLNCTTSSFPETYELGNIGIQVRLLTQNTTGNNPTQYARVDCGSIVTLGDDYGETFKENMYFRQKIKLPEGFQSSRICAFRFPGIADQDFQDCVVWPSQFVKTETSVIKVPNAWKADHENTSRPTTLFRVLFSSGAVLPVILHQGLRLLFNVYYSVVEPADKSSPSAMWFLPQVKYILEFWVVRSTYKIESQTQLNDAVKDQAARHSPDSSVRYVGTIPMELELFNDELMVVAHIRDYLSQIAYQCVKNGLTV